MANERRARPNFLSGTITDNPLTAGAAAFNSAALAGLEAITASEHCVVIFDPTGSGNGPDIAHITAHTAGATSATIARNREGSTAAEHAQGTDWLAGPTAADWPTMLASADDWSDGGGLPYPGQLRYIINKHRYDYYDHDAALWLPAFGLRPAARIFRTATQVIPENVWTAIAMTAEDYDTDGMHSGSAATLTIHTPGLWHFDAYLEFNFLTEANGAFGARIRTNGGRTVAKQFQHSPSGFALDPVCACSGDTVLADGDTVQLEGWQTGSAIGLGLLGDFALLSAHWLGPAE